MLHLPNDLFIDSNRHPALIAEGVSAVESCIHEVVYRDSAYLSTLEFIYLFSGELSITTKGQPTVTLKAGEAVLLKSGTLFSFEKRRDEQGRNYGSCLLFVDHKLIRDYLGRRVTQPQPEAVEHIAYQSYRGMPELSDFANSLRPYFGGKDLPKELLRIKTQELFFHLLRKSKMTKFLLYGSLETSPPVLRSLMEEHFSEPFSLKEFAALAHRSLSTFRRDFLLEFGIPPGKWLMQRRLDAAANDLLVGNDQAGEVAERVGFKSYAHFSRAFKQKFAFSPSSFRKRYRQAI